MQGAKNVLGGALECCCMQPLTGFYRDGCCNTGQQDFGLHIVCVEMTNQFLQYCKSVGNDLSTPRPEYDFPGLKAGDRWCLCAQRWVEAYSEGVAPRLYLRSTHEKMLEFVSLEVLASYGLDVV